MAWEKRGSRTYYYQSYRTRDGKVRKRYRGAGALAELSASLDAAAQAERRAAAAAWKEQKQEEKAITAALDRFSDEFDLLLTAAMLAAGFHSCKGQWRRKRG